MTAGLRTGLATLAAILAIGCAPRAADTASAPADASGGEAAAASAQPAAPMVAPPSDPYPSTYVPYPSETTAIVGATVLDGVGGRIEDGVVVIADGKVAAVGAAGAVAIPDGATRIDATGKTATPGIIDIHSHLGDYPAPSTESTSDGNEATSPGTAEVWAEHSVWPQDAGFTRALAGGVTTIQVLPGSANLFAGRSAIVKNVPARTVQEMKFPGAPYGLKMACGENPKRVYGRKGGPATRMGNFAGYRKAWIDAAAYKKKWDDYREKYAEYEEKLAEGGEDAEKAEAPEPPKRDLANETLAGVLSGDIVVNMHCYRADEMAFVLDMAEEFGYRVTTFHHAVEAYKIADLLAEKGVCAAMWADWWGFKLEAYDTVVENVALVDAQPNGCAIVHSDSDVGIQRLNQEAAKAMAAGRRMGLDIAPEHAMRWLTSNPARAMGIDDRTGSLEPGKMADVVLWSGDPFSVYTQAEKVWIDGALLYDRSDPALSPRVDFELGQAANAGRGGAGQ